LSGVTLRRGDTGAPQQGLTMELYMGTSGCYPASPFRLEFEIWAALCVPLLCGKDNEIERQKECRMQRNQG